MTFAGIKCLKFVLPDGEFRVFFEQKFGALKPFFSGEFVGFRGRVSFHAL
jgi:hypothetical protein